MVKANVDRIIDFLKTKKTASVVEISKVLSIPKEDIQRSTEYLEEDGIVKIDYRLTTPYVTFIKDPDSAVKLEEPAAAAQPKKDDNPVNGMQDMSKPVMPKGQMNQAFNDNSFRPQQESYQNQQPAAAQQMQSQKNEFPFLLDNKDAAPQNMFSQGPDQNADASLRLMDHDKYRIPDENPLEEKPRFDLQAPAPDENNKVESKPVLSYSDNYSEKRESNFPNYVQSDIDRIDYLIDFANKKITNHDFKDLNVLYRQIYNIYTDSSDMSANEKYMVGEKLNTVFERIKRTYLIEQAV